MDSLSHCIMVVIGIRRYSIVGNREWLILQMQYSCLIPVLNSISLVSVLVLCQQNFRDPGFWLLLLNARLVCNKVSLTSDLFTDERANKGCITETLLGLEGEVALSASQVSGVASVETPGQDGSMVIVI